MASLEIALMNPELWDIYQPNMYTLVTELRTNGKIAEVRKTQFGVRSYYFDADNGFFLNGKNVEIRGVNMHHDLGALGAAVNIRAMERQLEIMKGMGVNAIRTAHNPPAPELLDLCDQMGLLVMDEAFDVWTKGKKRNDYHIDFKENHEADLRDMILRDRNHPSVFMWSIGNEIPEQFDSLGLSITCELASIVKSMDTTRPVTCALTETDPAKNFIYQSGCLDVLGFNYKIFDWKNFKKNFPGQKMLAAENMSAYSTRGHYDMPSDSVRYWPRTYTEEIIGPNPDFTVSAYDNVCAYWGATHEATLRELYKHNFIAGMFIWSGFDFIGEPVPYEWPAKSSYYGVVDLAGFPKDIYHLYRSIWTGDTVLHVFPHWNWEEGQLVDIWAFYNHADEVELFLNNKSLGAKSKGPEDFHVMWRIPFEPGNLKAISRKDGVLVREQIIRTSDAPARIELVADREEIATGRDLSFITVNILDEAGNLVPDADNEVSFEIEGPGIIAGVDNGYQASHEPFKASKRKAWKGKCLAIIESGKEEGTITLKTTSDNLKGSEIEITIKNSL